MSSFVHLFNNYFSSDGTSMCQNTSYKKIQVELDVFQWAYNPADSILSTDGIIFFMYFFLFLASKRIFFELIVPGDGHLEFAWCISLTSLQLSVSFLCCDRASAWLIFVPMHASRLLARQAASAKGGCHCWSSKGEVDNCERRSQMWMYWLFLKVFIF